MFKKILNWFLNLENQLGSTKTMTVDDKGTYHQTTNWNGICKRIAFAGLCLIWLAIAVMMIFRLLAGFIALGILGYVIYAVFVKPNLSKLN